MDSSFFSQQMAPWRPNFPYPWLWTHYWHSFRWRQLGFVSTFTGYSTSSLVSVVLCSFCFSGSKFTSSPHKAVFTNAILVMYMRKWMFEQNCKFSNKNNLLCARRDFNNNKKIFLVDRYEKWNFGIKISPILHFYWVIDGWISGLKCKILIMYTTVSSLNLKKTFLDLELHNLTKTSHHITASSGMCFSKNSSCPWPFNAKVLVSPKIFQVVFSQSSYGHPCVLLAATFFETGAMATPTKS